MLKSKLMHISASSQSVLRSITKGMLTLALTFLILLLPMLFYCKNIFSSLEVQKKTQHLSFGISQLENTVYTTNSATQSLRQDTRFLPF